MDIKGKTFLVTGGASGLGGAVVERLSGLGANLMVLDINVDGATPKSNIKYYKADVTSEVDVLGALAKAKAKFGSIHGAVNCAGTGVPEKVLSKRGLHSLEMFSRVININLIGTFNVNRLVIQSIVEDTSNTNVEKGILINTSSVASFEGQIGQCAYSASKGGINALTLPLARECASYGIRVMTIAPGIFDTPMLAGLEEKARASLGAMVPFPKRLGQPSEYAFLVQHIIENEILNGEIIRLDGAIRMAPR